MTSQTDRRVQRGGKRGSVSTYMHHAHPHPSHTRTGRKHTSAPHLPRYQNTISPDKLECARACRFLTSRVPVTFLSELHVGFAWRQRNPKRTYMSSSLSLSLSVLSSGYCRVMQEYGAEVNITCCIILSFYKKFSNDIHDLIVNRACSYGSKLKIHCVVFLTPLQDIRLSITKTSNNRHVNTKEKVSLTMLIQNTISKLAVKNYICILCLMSKVPTAVNDLITGGSVIN